LAITESYHYIFAGCKSRSANRAIPDKNPYAVFTTPLVESRLYPQSIRDCWAGILADWLPRSGYEFDEERFDFEYYDERDHAWERDNMVQMDIYIPIQPRKA
jgi:AraC family transcriptional regulator